MSKAKKKTSKFKKIKWIFGTLVTLAIAVIVAGYAVLSTLDLAEFKALAQREVKAATGRDLIIQGPIDLQIDLTPTISIEDVAFANAPWGSRPQMATVKRFEITLDLLPLLSGDIAIEHLAFFEPDIIMEVNDQGQANWQFHGALDQAASSGDSGADTESAGSALRPKIPQFKDVEVRGGQVTFVDAYTGQSFHLFLKDLKARRKDGGRPLGLVVDAVFNDVPFTLTGDFSRFTTMGLEPFQFSAKAEAVGTKATIEGVIENPLTGSGVDVRLSAQGKTLASLSPLADADLPSIGPYDVSGRLTLADPAAPIKLSELNLSLGENTLTGEATADLSGARPKLTGSLRSVLLDLQALQDNLGGNGNGAVGTAPSSGQDSKYVFTAEPLPLEGLKAADAKIDIAVDTLRVQPGLDLEALKVSLALENGRLDVNPLSAQISGGSLQSNAVVDASGSIPKVQLKVSLAGLDYGRLMKSLKGDDQVLGTIDANVNLSGSGDSQRAVASSLNGDIEVIGEDGRFNDEIAGVLVAGLGKILDPFSGGQEGIELNCMVARFDIQDGLATSRAILIDTKPLIILGDGTVDLKTEGLDLKFDTESRNVSLASLSVPFLVKGTLKSPTAVPDPVGTATGALKIVGTVIMPLPAIAGILAEKEVSASGKNRCVQALETAEAKGDSGGQGGSEKSTLEKAGESVGETLEDVGEGISKGLKSLFGD